MTKAGLIALNKIMRGRRVAVQCLTNLLPYFIDGAVLQSENWIPVVLLPVRAANLDTPNWHIRCSPAFQKAAMEKAAREMARCRLLTPEPVRSTADQFAA